MAFPLIQLRVLRRWRRPTYPGAVSLAMMGPTSERPSVWLALTVLAGLPLALWAYKVPYLPRLLVYDRMRLTPHFHSA